MKLDALAPIFDCANAFGTIVSNTTSKQAIYLLKSVNDVDELKQLSKATEVLGSKTAGYITLFGKSKILRSTLRLADEVYFLIAGTLGLFVTIFFSALHLAFSKSLALFLREKSIRR